MPNNRRLDATTMDWYDFLYEHNDFDRSKLHIVSYDKFVVIFAPKLCSSVIRRATKDNIIMFSTSQKDILDLELSKPPYNQELSKFQLDNLEKIKKDIESIKNDTIKKDIIILIKDPFERYVSAFTEDFVKTFLREMNNEYDNYGFINPVYDSWFNEIGIPNNDIEKVLRVLNVNNAFNPTDSQIINDYRYKLVNTLVRGGLRNTNMTSAHHKPYLSSIVRFLDKLNRSRSKVKLLNIGEVDVAQYLSKYDDSYKDIGYINKSSELNNMVKESILSIITQEKIMKLSAKIHGGLYYEYEYYFKLLTDYQDLIYTPSIDTNTID